MNHVARPLLAALVLTCSALGGCASYLPFTDGLAADSALERADLSRLQFYNSREIRLRRVVAPERRASAVDHGIVVASGERVEELVIPRRTPGIAEGGSPGRLVVSFGPDMALVFARAPRGADTWNRGAEGGFATPPDDGHPARSRVADDVRYTLATEANGTIVLDGHRWELVGPSELAELEVEGDSVDISEERSTTLVGRRVD